MEDIKKQLSICTVIIAFVNVVCFILTEIFGPSSNTAFLFEHGALAWHEVINGHEYYRLITHMFLHGSFSHIANNMIVLLFVGSGLEKMIGKVRFLVVYFLSGVGGGLASVYMGRLSYERAAIVDKASYMYTVSVGASGAIFGVVGAMIYVVIRNKGRVENISRQQLAIFVVLSLYAGFTSTGTDNAAHVGGVLIGFMLAVLLYHPRRPRHDVADGECSH